MKRRSLLLVLSSLAFAVLAPAAPAQSFSDPGLGFGAALHLSEGRAADGTTVSGSLHVRYRLTGALGLEGAVGYRRETLGDAAGPLLSVREVPLTGTGQLFFLSRGRVQPYLLAGAGLHVIRTTPEGRNPSADEKTEALFTLHAGAGIDVRPSRASAVHLDARWFFLEPNALSDLAEAGYDVPAGYWAVALGVTFYR